MDSKYVHVPHVHLQAAAGRPSSGVGGIFSQVNATIMWLCMPPTLIHTHTHADLPLQSWRGVRAVRGTAFAAEETTLDRQSTTTDRGAAAADTIHRSFDGWNGVNDFLRCNN